MSTLFDYPKSAAFGRVLPKNKIYQHGGLNRRMQAAFVDQVDQIVWAFKLAPETVNLPAADGVAEIQIFSVRLRGRQIGNDILAAIDKAVAFPVIFELNFGDQMKVMAAHKRQSDADPTKWVISAYMAGEWTARNAGRQRFPLAINMAGLYEALLSPLMPDVVKAGEAELRVGLRVQIARIEELKALEVQIGKIESRLSLEKQFNRKVEINAELREAKSAYKAMKLKPLGEELK